jgi:hypothetical protein
MGLSDWAIEDSSALVCVILLVRALEMEPSL